MAIGYFLKKIQFALVRFTSSNYRLLLLFQAVFKKKVTDLWPDYFFFEIRFTLPIDECTWYFAVK